MRGDFMNSPCFDDARHLSRRPPRPPGLTLSDSKRKRRRGRVRSCCGSGWVRIFLARLAAHLGALVLSAVAAVPQSSGYGPEVKAFLSFLRQEESELQFQIAHKEISRQEFTKSKNRIAVHREAVLKFVRETGEDRVPDYNVVASSEANQLIENGGKLMKSAKPGDVLGNKWRFIGSETRGELFYVLERVSPGPGRVTERR